MAKQPVASHKPKEPKVPPLVMPEKRTEPRGPAKKTKPVTVPRTTTLTYDAAKEIIRGMFYDPSKCRDFWYTTPIEDAAKEFMTRAADSNNRGSGSG
jgi:hypothetical protein